MKQLKLGLTLILDYNEERQMYFEDGLVKESSLKSFENNDDDDDSVSLYLNTISIGCIIDIKLSFFN